MNNETNTPIQPSFADKLRAKLNAFAEKINTPFVQRVGNKLISKKHLYPSFAFPVMVLLIIYGALGVFPLGQRSILTLDMNAQYIFYFEQIRDVLVGKSSLIYTFERSLGGEFLGYYAYYLASPLSWLVALFPERLIVEAVTFIMILKCGFSGFFFAYYLEKSGRKIDMMGYAMFSTMYALCAYAMAYQSNTMWMDALMLLPLVTLGIEKLIKDGSFKFFIVVFAITVWSNYYIGYMCCIYVLLYTICYLCAHKNDEINNLNEKNHTVKSVLRVGIASFIALLIVATILFSAIYSLSFGKNEFQDSKFDFSLRFDFLDLFAKFFLGSYDTVRPEGSPNVYCGMLTLFMIPLYFISRKVSPRHKIAYGSLCLIFIASFSVNAIDLVWHGFQMPVWLNYRYSFMFTFVLLTMAYRGYEYLKETDFKFIFQIGVLLIFTLMFMQKLVEVQRFQSGQPVKDTMPDYEFIWVSIFFVALYLVFLYFAKNPKGLKQTAASALLVLVLLDTGIGAGMSWGHEVYECGYAYRNSHVQFLDDLQPTVDEIKFKDPSFYRMEKTQYRKNNENLALDINGFASSTSTLNANVIELIYNMGFAANSHWAKYFAGNEVVDSLFGVKYVISDNETAVSNLYEKWISEDSLPVYTNPYALSIAYAAHPNAKKLILTPPTKTSPFFYLEGMLTQLTGADNKLSIFENCTYSTSFVKTSNCTKSLSGNSVKFNRSNSEIPASFTYTVTANRDGCIYMHFLSSSYNKKMTYYVNDKEVSTFFDTDTNRIHNIGTFKKGDVITVKFEFDANTISYYTDAPIFVQVNEELFKESIAKLQDEGNLKITDYSDTRIEGTLTAKDNEFVFTTIPYDKYWQVYVDGERVEAYATMDTLLAFDVSAGTHEIKMVYVSVPFYAGLGVSAFGIALFALFIILERKLGWKLLPIKELEHMADEIESCNEVQTTEENATVTETNEEQL